MENQTAYNLLTTLSKALIDNGSGEPEVQASKDRIESYIVPMSTLLTKLEKIQHLILNTVGYNEDYRNSEIIHAEFHKVILWLEGLIGEALMGYDAFRKAFYMGSLPFQVECQPEKGKGRVRKGM